MGHTPPAHCAVGEFRGGATSAQPLLRDLQRYTTMKDVLRKPINTDRGGQLCRCIKAGYYKMGWTNFTREILGCKDGFIATAVLEIYVEEQET